MRKIIHIILITFISQLMSEAYLSGIFRDNMILQREKDIEIWGYGDPGDEVIVRISDQEIENIVNDDGKWMITFKPLKMSKEPIHFEFESEGYVVNLEDVLVGDVWFCSGQSNMVLSTSFANNAVEEIKISENPNIRLFTVTHSYELELNHEPYITDTWEYCTPDNISKFSATAYFFGRELNNELDIPIGLINSSYGSSMIEAWTSINSNQEIDPELEQRHYPSAIFNTMVYPFIDFSIKGFIWYQGERNTRTDDACFKYRYQLPVLIKDWRTHWNDNELPFYYVQLPNFKIDYNWALIRESMEVAESTEHTGMAITIDIGKSDNIHPPNKQEVGRRLSLLALKNTYEKDIIDSGPKYKSYKINNEQITLDFVNIQDGLKYIGDEITGFEIASDDRIFYTAEATINGNSIIISSKYTDNPVAVRYGWSSNPKCNIYNSADLPLQPFRTDSWPLNYNGF